jgi:predicted RNA-binding Zn-ribbon protein involved in translation (DUF1610 family)
MREFRACAPAVCDSVDEVPAMTTSNKLIGRRFELKPFPCPLCGEMVDISSPLFLLGSCQACCGDLIVDAYMRAARRVGERLAKLQHERILKAIQGDTP